MACKCCVDGCDDLSQVGVTYFPTPVKPTLFRKWVQALQPNKITADSLVCNQHFPDDDYEMIRGKLRLKGKVVPSLFGMTIKNNKKSNDNHEETTTSDNNQESRKSQENNQDVTDSVQSEKVDSEPMNDREKVSEPVIDSEKVSEPVNSELDRQSNVSVDENGQEKCTIVCQPEVFLPHDSDSEQEVDLHKGDIEDIIANYHIRQNKSVVDRLKQDNIKNSKNEKQNTLPPDKAEKDKLDKTEQEASIDESSETNDSSDLQYMGTDNQNKAKFIEISVNAVADINTNDTDGANDCLMLLEDVQVDVDPSSLLMSYEDSDEKADPISLLTSSDEDDVIIQEPHIDTVEVSDATDEDDVPLVKLVDSKPLIVSKPKPKSLDTLIELRVCEICDYTTASPTQMSRHKRKHNEKRYKCHLCEYKATHTMSLMYHMKSHKQVNMKTVNLIQEIAYVKLKSYFRCTRCTFKAKNKSDIVKHARRCESANSKVTLLHSCDLCDYKTARKHDLRRHQARKHVVSNDEMDEDYVP